MPVERYVKRPIVIEAIRVTKDNFDDIFNFTNSSDSISEQFFNTPSKIGESPTLAMIHLHTLEGVMRANIGDWIIKGVNCELYPCKHDIFVKTYTKVQQ